MPTPPVECPKCHAEMEAGFLVDFSQAAAIQSSWVEGAPERSFWTGIKIRGHERLPVTTYRCVGCGYLESYAGAR